MTVALRSLCLSLTLAAACALGACVPEPDVGDSRRHRRDAGEAIDEDAGTSDAGVADDGGEHGPDGGEGDPDGGAEPDAGVLDAGPGEPLPDGSSVEVGRTLWGSDFAVYDDVPAGGLLFSVWSRITDPPPASGYWERPNMDVFVLNGVGWHMRCLGGNIHVYSADNYTYNANSMLFADPAGTWVEDYSFYLADPGFPEAEVHDWVWLAWQVIVESDAFVIRQWVKFGPDRPVLPMIESRPTFSEVRDILVSQRGWSSGEASAWTPGPATSFQVGSDHGYLFHARMDALTSTPTLGQLEEIAAASAASTAAWADYAFTWHDGAADLTDSSGHQRHLQLAPGGQLHQGPAPPY